MGLTRDLFGDFVLGLVVGFLALAVGYLALISSKLSAILAAIQAGR